MGASDGRHAQRREAGKVCVWNSAIGQTKWYHPCALRVKCAEESESQSGFDLYRAMRGICNANSGCAEIATVFAACRAHS